MLILRRIYMPQGCLGSVLMACTNGLASDQIVVAIGNLRIDSLGKIEPCSDSHKVYLCPVGYKARRLYWSMTELDSLVMYFMTIKKEVNKNVVDEPPPNSASADFPMAEVPVAVAAVRRRKIMEPVDSRCIKRSKPMECKQETIYEMDEHGNLQQISGPFTGAVRKGLFQLPPPQPVEPSLCSVSESRKINRRFPINTKCAAEVDLSDNCSRDRLVPTTKQCAARLVQSSSVESIPMAAIYLGQQQQQNNCQLTQDMQQQHIQSSPHAQHQTQIPRRQNQSYVYRHFSQPQATIPKTLRLMKAQAPPKVLTINKITHLQQQLNRMPHTQTQQTLQLQKQPQQTPLAHQIAQQKQQAPQLQMSDQTQKQQTPQQQIYNQNEKKHQNHIAHVIQQQKQQAPHLQMPIHNQKPQLQMPYQIQKQPQPIQQQPQIHTKLQHLQNHTQQIQQQQQTQSKLQQIPHQIQNQQPHHLPHPQPHHIPHLSQRQPLQPAAKSLHIVNVSSRPLPIPSTLSAITSTTSLIGARPNTTPAQRIFKLMKLPSLSISSAVASRDVSRASVVLPVNSSTTGHGGSHHPSVLRTVLTDKSQHLAKRVVTNESPYFISSCGSLVNLNAPQLPQYDGEADDCSMLTDSHFSAAGSVCSDQENMSLVVRRKSGPKPRLVGTATAPPVQYMYSLRFVVHGFKGSKSPRSSWTYLVRKIAQLRKGQGLTEYALRTGDGWAKFGLEHRHVVHLVEQMVGAFQCHNYDFKFHKGRVLKLREQCTREAPSLHGSARFNPWTGDGVPRQRAVDPLSFLHCKANRAPKNHAVRAAANVNTRPKSDQSHHNADDSEDSPEPDEDYLQRLAMQFRQLQNGSGARQRNVRVCCSGIHGRGLFARRAFLAHEVIIEYVGEVIRSILSDVREAEYQKGGLDCYMFRLDQEFIVDATFKGNAARFINHSCRPNCYAKVVRFEGDKHIIIIAQRSISKGEELTYNYRFPIEDDKLACTCGSFSCKKYLN